MKDIGNIFKEKREEIGVKLEEAASDLDITVAQLENLEDGNINAFKDIFFVFDVVVSCSESLSPTLLNLVTCDS